MLQVKPDVVYQLASASVGSQDPQNVLPTFENDLRATVNTLIAVRDLGCSRVIITRSLDEPEADSAPSSPYAAAKAASGLYGRMFHELYGVPVVMLRPFMTYGPGQKDYKVIPYTIQSMLKGETPTLGAGTRQVDWVYVDDVIAAFVAAATKPEAVGREIDLGSGALVSIREVVERIHQMLPGSPAARFGGAPERVNERVHAADLGTAELALNWRPAISLPEGLSQTIDWYRARATQAASEANCQGGVSVR
jgi:nucleoside-diphosphate-sugar epimerase